MGACISANSTSSRINAYMANKENEENKVIKLLLLGPGSTGKSTLFQSLRMSHTNGEIELNDRKGFVQSIRLNIIDGINTLIIQSNKLYNKDPILYTECKFIANETNDKYIELINKFYTQATEDTDGIIINSEILLKLANAIEIIWNLDCIKLTYKYCDKNFAISDNLEHFFNNIRTIMDIDYIPTEIDCLKNRNQTSGIFICLFVFVCVMSDQFFEYSILLVCKFFVFLINYNINFIRNESI